MNLEFEKFPKMARLSREITITEKIDGTNAQIYIPDTMDAVYAGSRNRWITPEADNFGFASWVKTHEAEILVGLGPGRHYGEWWGKGIGRGYGLNEKRFSLFNTARWNKDNLPACCSVVPVLYQGSFTTDHVEVALSELAIHGSVAVPGFMDPEGIVIYHSAANICFKKTVKNDEFHKGELKGGEG